MINLKESKLQEKVQAEVIKEIWDEALVFIKNIKRMKNVEQYEELLKRWFYWVDNRLLPTMKLMGFAAGGTDLFDDTKIKQTLEKMYKFFGDFLNWARDAFLPTKLDLKRYEQKLYDLGKYNGVEPHIDFNQIKFVTNVIYRMIIGVAPKEDYLGIPFEVIMNDYFTIFKNVESSKYIALKKGIDKFFTMWYNYILKANNMLPELYIKNTISIMGTKVTLEYREDELNLIKESVLLVKKAYDILIKNGFKRVIRCPLLISTIEKYKYGPNMLDGKDVGVGAYYHIQEKRTVIFIPRTLDEHFDPVRFITSLVHELGHYLDYEVLKQSQKELWYKFYLYVKDQHAFPFPTKYASKNNEEFFAETFTAYNLIEYPKYTKNVYQLFYPVFEKFLDVTNIVNHKYESLKKPLTLI